MAHMTDMFGKTNEYAHIIVGYIPQHISSAYPYYIPVLLGLEHFSAISSKVGLDEDHTYI